MESARAATIQLPLAIPSWANWLAIDSAGQVWAYEHKPTAGNYGWELGSANDDDYRRVMVADAGFWWVDVATVPDVYADWRAMLWQVGQ
jgi:hypothetical protein